MAIYFELNQELEVSNNGLASLDYWRSDGSNGMISERFVDVSNAAVQFEPLTAARNDIPEFGLGADPAGDFQELLWILDQGPS